jgi:hypothetical protein
MTYPARPQDRDLDSTDERPTAEDQLLTIAEVAAIVRVPVATLRYWRHLGTGPRSFRVGRGVPLLADRDHQVAPAAERP